MRTVISCLRYRDAPAAIEWLCSVFGFEKHVVHAGANGTVAHAQLKHGTGMVMLGSMDNGSEWGRLMKHPADLGGAGTQSAYVVVADADAVHARVQAAGTEILIPLHDEDYGGRGFGCRDLEGHIWYFGTYDPWT